MKKQELNKYIPSRVLLAKGRTLKAIYYFFLQEDNVTHAAEHAGISRQAAFKQIGKIREAMIKDGWKLETKTIINWKLED